MLGGGLLDKRNDNRGFKNLPKNVVIQSETKPLSLKQTIIKESCTNSLFYVYLCLNAFSIIYIQVNFISSLIGVRPGPALRQRISNVMNGKEEGKDPSPEDEENKDAERAKFRTRKQVPQFYTPMCHVVQER